MRHPVAIVPAGRARVAAFALLAIPTLALLPVVAGDLVSSRTPYAIVSLELAAGVDEAQRVVDVWAEEGRLAAARTAVVWDFAFLLAYSLTLPLGCLLAGDAMARAGQPGAAFATPMAWLQTLAALLDALENVALLRMLAPGPVVSPWPQVACVCAASKFAFVIAGIVFMVLYTSVGLWLSRRGEPQA